MISPHTVFEIQDLRQKILNLKTEHARMERTAVLKNIYRTWDNDGTIKSIKTIPSGKTHEKDTKYTTWSLRMDDSSVDEIPLIITDHVEENGEIVYYDGVVNVCHLKLKEFTKSTTLDYVVSEHLHTLHIEDENTLTDELEMRQIY